MPENKQWPASCKFCEIDTDCPVDCPHYRQQMEKVLTPAPEAVALPISKDSLCGDTCRVCGCTDDHACEGGCYWVEPDLCSRCAEIIEQEEKEEAAIEHPEPEPVQDAPEVQEAAPDPPEKKPRQKKSKLAPAKELPETAQVAPAQEVTGDPLADALDKIRAEMTSSYSRAIGNFLLRHLVAYPDDAGKILAKDKTIKGSLDEMQKEAEKHRSGSYAVLTDEEGFAVVLKYYGIDSAALPRPAAPVVMQPAPGPVQEAKKPVSFDVSLDDLL